MCMFADPRVVVEPNSSACALSDSLSSSIMSLDLSTLPTVLVQSIMQPLCAKEIIAVARCSKWPMQCANSVFAWRHCTRVNNVQTDSETVLSGLLGVMTLARPAGHLRFFRLSVH